LTSLDPIIGIDTTEDGKFLLATCKSYLLVIAAEAENDEGEKLSGFSKPLGKNKASIIHSIPT
jgi:hypothetical protein